MFCGQFTITPRLSPGGAVIGTHLEYTQLLEPQGSKSLHGCLPLAVIAGMLSSVHHQTEEHPTYTALHVRMWMHNFQVVDTDADRYMTSHEGSRTQTACTAYALHHHTAVSSHKLVCSGIPKLMKRVPGLYSNLQRRAMHAVHTLVSTTVSWPLRLSLLVCHL